MNPAYMRVRCGTPPKDPGFPYISPSRTRARLSCSTGTGRPLPCSVSTALRMTTAEGKDMFWLRKWGRAAALLSAGFLLTAGSLVLPAPGAAAEAPSGWSAAGNERGRGHHGPHGPHGPHNGWDGGGGRNVDYVALGDSYAAGYGGGKYALVIGLGGLGQMAVQILKALTGATVIATDMKEDAMKRAEDAGAIVVPGGEGQVERIREITGGRGVDAAFDFVGVGPTIKTAAASMAPQSRFTVVGIAGGAYEWSFFTTPYESTMTNTYWGTIEDLHEVVAMYRAGQIKPEVELYAMDNALEAYRKLEAGELSGRAVVPLDRG